jgi:hypothetical protein
MESYKRKIKAIINNIWLSKDVKVKFGKGHSGGCGLGTNQNSHHIYESPNLELFLLGKLLPAIIRKICHSVLSRGRKDTNYNN